MNLIQITLITPLKILSIVKFYLNIIKIQFDYYKNNNLKKFNYIVIIL